MIETICFNPLRISDAFRFDTSIAVTVVKFPPFRVHGGVVGKQANTSVWPQSTLKS